MRRPIPELDFSFSELSGTRVERVPVLTVFGATPAGQTMALHIHKALSYFYVPFPVETSHEVESFLSDFGKALDDGLNETASFPAQRVFNLQLVTAKDIYGYHPEEEVFIKVVLYNPQDISKAGALLQKGRVQGICFQPYETHLPFLLQFKMDYNLFGMGHLDLRTVRFRTPLPDRYINRHAHWKDPGMKPSAVESLGADLQVWTSQTTPAHLMGSPNYSFVRRQTSCALEADACVDDILNVHQLKWDSLDEIGPEIRMLPSLEGFWPEDTSFLGSTEILHEPQGELCEAVTRVKNKIKEMQELYKGSNSVKASMSASTAKKRSTWLSLSHAASRRGGTPITPANSLLDRYTFCACPSPIHEEMNADMVSDEDESDTSQRAGGEPEAFDDYGLLMELADAAEEDREDPIESAQQEIQDIMTCYEGSDDEEGRESGESASQKPETAPEPELCGPSEQIPGRGADESQSQSQGSDPGVDAGVGFMPKMRPPSREEIEQNLPKCVIESDNARPRFTTEISLGPDQIPYPSAFDLPPRHPVPGKKSALPQLLMVWVYQDSKGFWIWGSCAQPPSRGEIDDWLNQNEEPLKGDSAEKSEMELTELPSIAEESDYRQRPDSPDYDESSNFFFTSRSLSALTTEKKSALPPSL